MNISIYVVLVLNMASISLLGMAPQGGRRVLGRLRFSAFSHILRSLPDVQEHLKQAISNENISAMRKLLAQNTGLVKEGLDHHLMYILVKSFSNSDIQLQMIQELINAGCKVPDDILFRIIVEKSADRIKCPLALFGELLTLKDKSGNPVVDVNKGVGNLCQSALHVVNDVEIAHVLLAAGAFVDIQDKNGLTPLHHAVLHVNVEKVKILLRHGANPAVRNCQKERVLDFLKREYFELRSTCESFEDNEELKIRARLLQDIEKELEVWILYSGQQLSRRGWLGQRALPEELTEEMRSYIHHS